MAVRRIELDEESDRILTELADDYGGDVDLALGDLIKAHHSLESLAELSEAAQGDALASQRERSEQAFREGRFKTWEEVKRANNL